MIPKDIVDKILSVAKVEEVVGDFVSLRRSGANYWACCPFHNEKTPSFSVNPAKGIYYCFGCHEGGSAVGFVMKLESMTYPEALKYLARKYNIEIVEKEETDEEREKRQRREALLNVMDYAAKFFQDNLQTPEGHSTGYAYFRSRKLEDETIRKFGLGWAPRSGHDLLDDALAKKHKEEYLKAVDLCREKNGRTHDTFVERAMFPIHDISGRIVAFGGRTLLSSEELKARKIGMKYLNSAETEIYHKSDVLYGLYFAKSSIAKENKCYVVEGYLDVLSMHQLGITNVVAASGTAFGSTQIRLIKRFTDNITLMFDGDAAGIKAAKRAISLCLPEKFNVRVVLFPDGQDADDFAKSHTLGEAEEFLRTHEQDFVSYTSDMLLAEAGGDPIREAEVIMQVADCVALVPDTIKRAIYVKQVAKRFGIDEQVIFARVAETIRKIKEKEEKYPNVGGGEPGSGPKRPDDVDGTPVGTPEDGQDGLGPEGPQPPVPEPEPKTPNGLESPVTAPSERELLSFILQYGFEFLEFEKDSEYYTEEKSRVFEYIDDNIAGQPFLNSLYRSTYDAYVKLYYDEKKVYSQDAILSILMNGEDRNVADVVADLCLEKYELTVKGLKDSMTVTSSYLAKEVPKAIYVYDLKLLEVQKLDLLQRMRECQHDGAAEDPEETKQFVIEMEGILKNEKRVKKSIAGLNGIVRK